MERATSAKLDVMREVKEPVCNTKLPLRRRFCSLGSDNSPTRQAGKLNYSSRIRSNRTFLIAHNILEPTRPIHLQLCRGKTTAPTAAPTREDWHRLGPSQTLCKLANPGHGCYLFDGQTPRTHPSTDEPGNARSNAWRVVNYLTIPFDFK